MSGQAPFAPARLIPGSWAGVSSQLARCLTLAADEALPATLLLVGEPGLGREALALELAAGLVCRSSPRARCSCSGCERVRRGTHPDVVVIDVLPGKTEISIEQAREVNETLPQRPYEGARRVFIFASGQTPPLNVEAASALLKTLEEPPHHSCLILLAANPARVLPTVVSRAVQLRVAPPTQEELTATLEAVLAVDTGQASSLLEACQGDTFLALESAEGTANATMRELAACALGGDSLALLRLAALVKSTPRGIPLAVAALLSLARSTSNESAEAALDAAAALIVAGRRQEILHTDLEGAVAGVLASLARH